MDANLILTILACGIFIYIFGRIFILPFKSIFKLILNSILGGAIIFIINLIGASFNFVIGLNMFTAIFVRNTRGTRCCASGCIKTDCWMK